MHRATPITAVLFFASVGLLACGNPGGSDDSGGSGGSAAGGGNAGSSNAKANGLFEIHYIGETPAVSSHTEITGHMYDGAAAELVIWDKKKTDGDCALYTPRTPFCESCESGQVCVDTNTCRKPPVTHAVGDVTLTGLNPPSSANPLMLTEVTNDSGMTYISAEMLPMPPCTAGGVVSMSATGNRDYSAFSIQTQCIPPLVVTNSSVAIEGGKTFTLTWTPSSVTESRIQLTFNLNHHGGSTGKIICDTADTGSLSVSGTLLQSLIALGVTGYPKATINRAVTGTTTVGSGQAQLELYSDVEFVAQLPGLVSCETDAECPTGQTCQVPGQMCGISCTSNAQCPSGQTCLSTTKICG
jgi:hypothetical protein